MSASAQGRASHTIRFPKWLYNRIKKLAKREHRSFNAQVIHMLAAEISLEHTFDRVRGKDESEEREEPALD